MVNVKLKIILTLWINLLVSAAGVYVCALAFVLWGMLSGSLNESTDSSVLYQLIMTLVAPLLGVLSFGVFAGIFFSIVMFIFESLFLLFFSKNLLSGFLLMLVIESLLVGLVLGTAGSDKIPLVISYFISQALRYLYVDKLMRKNGLSI